MTNSQTTKSDQTESTISASDNGALNASHKQKVTRQSDSLAANIAHHALLTDDELMRYSRQILLEGWDLDAQQRLKASRVALVGMGGLGCPAALQMVRSGLGYLRLIDADVVDTSNIQRQTLYYPPQIGQAKVDASVASLKLITAWCDFNPRQLSLSDNNVLDALADVDLVLDCSDNFATRDLINRTTRQLGVPLISAAAIGRQGQLAMFNGESACYACLFGVDHQHDDANCQNSGVLATTTAVMGAMQAHLALLWLGQGVAPLLSKFLSWDGATMAQRIFTITKDPACVVCGVRQVTLSSS